MRLIDFDYDLPQEFIAQRPLAKRDQSRLLVLHRTTGAIEHRRFRDLLDYLRSDDLLVLNDTRVSALRLMGHKPTGAKVEALLLRNLGGNQWEALVKPGRRIAPGSTVVFEEGLSARVLERTESGGRILDFGTDSGVSEAIEGLGLVPLPPYIRSAIDDAERYQTVYAVSAGSAAAPTAGLHFTPGLLAEIRAVGVRTAFVTLHVGMATFRPVRTEHVEDHIMHKEMVSISSEAASAVNSARGRIIAVGTTTARSLEAAAVGPRTIEAFEGETDLFVTPGHEFNIVEVLVTNFHMPRSTLLMLVSAFAGRELIMHSYEEAKREGYRFLSFGDAMLIL